MTGAERLCTLAEHVNSNTLRPVLESILAMEEST